VGFNFDILILEISSGINVVLIILSQYSISPCSSKSRKSKLVSVLSSGISCLRHSIILAFLNKEFPAKILF